MHRYGNGSACFISAYSQGLSGPEAAWENWQYHGHDGHHTLPPDMVENIKRAIQK